MAPSRLWLGGEGVDANVSRENASVKPVSCPGTFGDFTTRHSSDSRLGLWNILAGCQLLGLILVQRQAAHAASAAGGVRADEGHESQLPQDEGFRREWRPAGRALSTHRRQGHPRATAFGLAPDPAGHGSTAMHCTELLHSELWAPRPLCGPPPGRTRPAKGFGRLQKTKSQLKVT